MGTADAQQSARSNANPQPSASATADSTSTTEVLKTLDQLIEQNRQLEQQTQKLQEENKQLLEQIRTIRQGLAATPSSAGSPAAATSGNVGTSGAKAPAEVQTREPDKTSPQGSATVTAAVEQEQPKTWGKYTPNQGYKVAETPKGDLSVSIYTYIRYLNQRLLDPTFTDSFGNVKSVQQRQDVQITKDQIKFLGWLLSPKFRYFLYGWTNNAAQGLQAQVVLAGNLNYQFSKYFTFSGGITSLPGVRSTEGNFPFWLGVDSRFIADEFFRPSYTSGMWAKGDITNHLRYQAMVGNNLSTLESVPPSSIISSTLSLEHLCGLLRQPTSLVPASATLSTMTSLPFGSERTLRVAMRRQKASRTRKRTKIPTQDF